MSTHPKTGLRFHDLAHPDAAGCRLSLSRATHPLAQGLPSEMATDPILRAAFFQFRCQDAAARGLYRVGCTKNPDDVRLVLCRTVHVGR